MRIYTKKLLTFLLVLALLLSSMNIILSVFAAETGVNLQLNGGTLQGSSEVYSAGDALPDSAMITRAGAAFGGWYTDAEFTGDRIFTVPSDAAAGTTYYARWIYYSFDFVNFDSYNTDSDMTAVWLNWGTDVADYSLNSDSAHAASGKSMKIDIKQANTNADIVTQTYNNTKSGDGIAFWVESANGITVKFRFNGKSQYISHVKNVPAGKHFVMIPWSELGESLTASYLWQAEFFIKVPNADETVYLDDIGTYVDYSTNITYNINGGSWAEGYIPDEVYNKDEGLTLPVMSNVNKDGFAFAGWYDNEELTGNAAYSIPAGTLGNKKYWAKWIYHLANCENFESYGTNDELNAKWLNWADTNASFSLNTDSAHANSGKSMKIDFVNANANSNIALQDISFSRTGDGVAFWIESENGATVKFTFNTKFSSGEKIIPGGKHIVTIPWTEFGDISSISEFWRTQLLFKVANVGDTVYVDDIGVYSEHNNLTFNTNGGSWSDGYTPADGYGPFGITLPDSGDIKKVGLAFAGWYDNKELSGNAVYSIAAGTLGNKEYWAKWICNSANFDSFESYNTNADMLNADHWDDFHWPAQNSVTSLNTDPAHANNSEKSLKVSPNAANTFAQLVVQRVNFPQNGDGIAFWIESDNGATVKVRLRNTTYESQERTVPGGKHIVTIPWSEMNGAYDADWLSPTKIFVSVPNGSDAVYIDDIGTYAVPNGITANWENGFTHSYDENGKTVWNYSKTADDSSYIGFATDYVLEKGKNYVIAFEYKYLKDGNLAWSLEPQAVGSAFDESEIMQQTDESKQTLNSKDRNSDWATKKIVFAADGENKYLAFFGKTEAGAEYDISIKNIRLYALGDVDFNGNIDTSDLASLKKSLLGAESIIEFADVNNDGKTDILDLISLKKMLAK